MLNYIWLALLPMGIAVAAINGNIEVVTQTALQSANDAVAICINLIGVMCLWLGIRASGKKPALSKPFPDWSGRLWCGCSSVPSDHPARSHHNEPVRQHPGFGFEVYPLAKSHAGTGAVERWSQIASGGYVHLPGTEYLVHYPIPLP